MLARRAEDEAHENSGLTLKGRRNRLGRSAKIRRYRNGHTGAGRQGNERKNEKTGEEAEWGYGAQLKRDLSTMTLHLHSFSLQSS